MPGRCRAAIWKARHTALPSEQQSADLPPPTAQLKKFLVVLAAHRKALEEQMADLVANLDEVKTHEREARALLAKSQKIQTKT